MTPGSAPRLSGAPGRGSRSGGAAPAFTVPGPPSECEQEQPADETRITDAMLREGERQRRGRGRADAMAGHLLHVLPMELRDSPSAREAAHEAWVKEQLGARSAEPAARKGLVSRAVTAVVHTVYEILEQIGIGRRP